MQGCWWPWFVRGACSRVGSALELCAVSITRFRCLTCGWIPTANLSVAIQYLCVLINNLILDHLLTLIYIIHFFNTYNFVAIEFIYLQLKSCPHLFYFGLPFDADVCTHKTLRKSGKGGGCLFFNSSLRTNQRMLSYPPLFVAGCATEAMWSCASLDD